MTPSAFQSGLASLALTLLLAPGSDAQVHMGTLTADGSQEVPANGSAGTAEFTVTLDQGSGTVSVDGSYSGLTGNATAAHIHGPAAPGSNAGVMVGLSVSGGSSGTVSSGGNVNASQQADLLAGMTYLNLHSTVFGGGEIRGQIYLPWLVWNDGSPCVTGGVPELVAKGTFQGGTSNSVEVSGAPASATAFLVMGLSSLRASFKGGTLGPNPDFLIPLPTDAGGNLTLPYVLPAAPPGVEVWIQFWIQDAGGASGFCSTPALRGTTQ